MFTVTGPAGTDTVVAAAAGATTSSAADAVNRQSAAGCSVGSTRLRYVASACQHPTDDFALPVESNSCNASTCWKPSSAGGSFGTMSGELTMRQEVRPSALNAAANVESPT